MQEPAYPADEAHRVATLRGLGLPETPGEERFDRLARLASRALNLPLAAICLADGDRIRLKSAVGLEVSEIPRPTSFCGHTILEPDHGDDMNVLIQSADRAMYTAKEGGGNQFITFDQGSP